MGDSQNFKRLSYFTGQILTADDFKLEQEYFREKLKRHNRSLHGFGIVSGLKVTASGGEVAVEPGLALDCAGNELAIAETLSLACHALAPPAGGWHAAYVNLRYLEEFAGPTPIAGAAANASAFSYVLESFEISVAPENCNRGHRHLRARWLACGQPHALTIAKLRHGAHGWHVDRSYRPPAIK